LVDVAAVSESGGGKERELKWGEVRNQLMLNACLLTKTIE